MTQVTITSPVTSVPLMKLDTTIDVDLAKFSETVLNHVFDYGLRQILNDAMASGKTDAERRQLAEKRLDTLYSGNLRASGVRVGDPVKRRAIEIATAKVKVSPKFIAWVNDNKPKAGASDKEKLAWLKTQADAVRKNAEKLAQAESIMAQAKIDVEAASAIDVEVDLDF